MARFSDDFLAELRMRCDIEQLISGYVPLKRRGKNLVGLCPFHNEKTPSFTVYPETQSYYCFGCGAGGEAINFIRRIENLDYIEAVRFLCDKSGMAMPTDSYDNSMAEKRKRMYDINREAARFFHDYLFSPEGKVGLDYYKSRGYSKKTLVRFGMGYAPDNWDSLLKYMRSKGYSYEELYEANLANKSTKTDRVRYYDSFRNRVMVPIIDARGNVVAFGGRVLDDSKPKYINTSDTLVYKKSLGVFGLNFAKNSKEKSLIVVEGYMDAISLHQAGFDNAIACLGTALTSEMAHLLSRYADEVILSYDADEAGQKATERAINIFSSIGIKLRVVRLTGGKDPDEILKKFGPERYRSLIDGASNDIEFALLKERQNFDLESSDGKLKYLTKAAEILAGTRNLIAQDIYASRLAQELEVEKQTIMTRISQIRRRQQNNKQRESFQKIQQNSMTRVSRESMQSGSGLRSIRAQERIIALLVKNPDFLPMTNGKIESDDFTVAVNKKLFRLIAEKIKNGDSLDLTCFADSLDNDEMSELVRLTRMGDELADTKKEFSDCINVMLDEKNKTEGTNLSVSQMSDEDFIKLFQKK
ncbi:MAG: DNA primase [Faecalibacterium sp.]|nr:DNA primase [Ruminococcus sp.]MCM1391431.1 DNA primase [Ruminococcus sp.]MCM1485105.1 DNA primase [Faecalibacterium sp.]